MFFDADEDGALDLFVAYYVQWSPQIDVFSTIDGERKSYAKSDLYQGSSSRLYVQRQGRYVDVTRESGVFKDSGKALAVGLWDFNQDGRLDIAVANDTQPNFLFEAQGGARFIERALEAGIAYDENGGTRAGMGIDIGDTENNATAAIVIGNFSREPVSLFKMVGPGVFREASQQAGVSAPTYLSLTFGLLFADFDLDGWQDLVIANGHIEPRIQEVEAEVSYRQPVQLLGNDGKGRFIDWSASAGEALQAPIVGRGLAVGDMDEDGDLDFVVSENNGPLHLLRNDTPLVDRHYLRVTLAGNERNTDAIGAPGVAQRRPRAAPRGAYWLLVPFAVGADADIRSGCQCYRREARRNLAEWGGASDRRAARRHAFLISGARRLRVEALKARIAPGCLKVHARPSSCARSSGGARSERFEEATPATFRFEDPTHFVAARSVTVQSPMFKFDTRRVLALGDEAHFHLGIQSRIRLPVSADVPGEYQPRVRFPQEHTAPVARASVVTALVPATADMRLNYCVHRLGPADLVGCEWPPGADLFSKHLPDHRLGCLNVDDPKYAVRIDIAGHGRFRHHCFLSFAALRSATALNASSVSPQNPSSQSRNPLMPRSSTPYRRWVPSARTTTSPAAFSTLRCWETAERLTSIPSAIALTERVPLRNRMNTRRRVGSPSASKARSELITTCSVAH